MSSATVFTTLVAGAAAQCNPAIVPLGALPLSLSGVDQIDECCTTSSIYIVPGAITDAQGQAIFGGPLKNHKPCMMCPTAAMGFDTDGNACLSDPAFVEAWNADPTNGNHACGCREARESDMGADPLVVWNSMMTDLSTLCTDAGGPANHVPMMWPTLMSYSVAANFACCLGGPVLSTTCTASIAALPIVGGTFQAVAFCTGEGANSGLTDHADQRMKAPGSPGAYAWNLDFCAKSFEWFIDATGNIDPTTLNGIGDSMTEILTPGFVEGYKAQYATPAGDYATGSDGDASQAGPLACFGPNKGGPAARDCAGATDNTGNGASTTETSGPSDDATTNPAPAPAPTGNEDSGSIALQSFAASVAMLAAALW